MLCVDIILDSVAAAVITYCTLATKFSPGKSRQEHTRSVLLGQYIAYDNQT